MQFFKKLEVSFQDKLHLKGLTNNAVVHSQLDRPSSLRTSYRVAVYLILLDPGRQPWPLPSPFDPWPFDPWPFDTRPYGRLGRTKGAM